MNYSFEDVFIGVEDALFGFHLLLVFEIDLLDVVMEADLRGSLEKSDTFLALHEQVAEFGVEKCIELCPRFVFLEV